MEKKSPKNYFNEEYVTRLILEYQKTAVTEKDENGKIKILKKDKELERKITIEVEKIVKAIIQVYRYYIFEPYEDCLQHGLMSCYTNFIKWTPKKGTAFNYFSIIAKRSLLNYTDRRQRHRNHSDIEEQVDLHGKEYINFDFYNDEIKDTIISIINSNYLGKKRKKYIKISLLLHDYLYKTKKFVSKTDFYSWCRSVGMRSIDVREFMNAIRKNGLELFEDVA